MNITHILFDADDTLFDYRSAADKALLGTLRDFGLPHAPEMNDRYQEINQPLWKRRERGEIDLDTLQKIRFRLFFEHIGADGDPDAFNAAYLTALGRYGKQTFPGVEEVIINLKDRYTLAIVTNGISQVQHSRFDDCPITAHFDGVFISDDIGLKKPDKEYFDHVLSALGDPNRENVLIVGDSLTSDIRGGINAGIHTCWFNPHGKDCGDTVPEFTISSLEEIYNIL